MKTDVWSTECRAYVATLIIFPLLLLAVNRSWVFPPGGFTDPWFYSGYHVHFAWMWKAFPSAYYGSRVPWTVLGSVVHHVAGPEPSLIILALLTFYASVLSLFYTIYRIFNNAAAGFIAACALGTSSWFLLAAGWNYIDGPTIACILVSLAAVSEAARGAYWRAAAVAWGILTTVLITIYPMNIVFVPVEALIFIGLDRQAHRRLGVPGSLLWLSGFIIAIPAIGLANHLAGGAFDFITPTLSVLSKLTPSGTKEQFYVPLLVWLPGAYWLLLPGFAFFASLIFMMARSRGFVRSLISAETSSLPEHEISGFVCAGACVTTVCGFIFMQALHWNVLGLFFRANALWPMAFLAIGAFIAIAMSNHTANEWIWAAVAGATCLTPWLLGTIGLIHAPFPYDHRLYSPLLFTGLTTEALWVLGGGMLLSCAFFLRGRVVVLFSIAFLSFVSIGTLSPSAGMTVPQDAYFRDRSLAVFDASGIIDANALNTPIWWSPSDPNQDIFSSLGSMYLQPSPAAIGHVGRYIILLSKGARVAQSASALVNDLSIEPARWHVERGSTIFDLAIGEVRSTAAP